MMSMLILARNTIVDVLSEQISGAKQPFPSLFIARISDLCSRSKRMAYNPNLVVSCPESHLASTGNQSRGRLLPQQQSAAESVPFCLRFHGDFCVLQEVVPVHEVCPTQWIGLISSSLLFASSQVSSPSDSTKFR